MVVSNDGKNRIRDLIAADIISAEFGEGGTAVTVGDTDLETPDPTADTTPTITTGDKIINVSYTKPSTIGAGTTYKEGGVKMTGDKLLSRVVYPDFDATVNNDLQIIDVIRVG